MRTMSDAMRAHLKGDATTCAELVRVMRRDGVTVGVTDHDEDIVYAGVRYAASAGYTGTRLRIDSALKSNDYGVCGLLDGAVILESDLECGLYDHARIDVYMCNWADLSQGVIHLRRGWLGEVRFAGGQYVADLRGFQDLLDRKVCETYTPECRFDLGEARCGVDVSALAVTGSVTARVDAMTFEDSARGEPDATFQDAKLTWLSGANAGRSVEVRVWDGVKKRFSLWMAAERPIAVGDTYSVTPGCDKRFATCKARFGNGTRYGGFPHLPGLAKILDVPEQRV